MKKCESGWRPTLELRLNRKRSGKDDTTGATLRNLVLARRGESILMRSRLILADHRMPTDNDSPSLDASRHHNLLPQELFALLYADLHRIATRELRRNSAVRLTPTTLLHETFLNLSPRICAAFKDQSHFMAYAARAMRSLIVDQLRNRAAYKRGGHYQITSLPTEPHSIAGYEDGEIEELSEALDALATTHPRLAECVDLKFFCGYSLGEIAKMWEVSERTVQRDWDKARLLLQDLLRGTDYQQPAAS